MFKKLGLHTLIYGIGQILTQFINFIFIPIYTNPAYLTISENGLREILFSFMKFTEILINIGISTAYLRHFYDNEKKHNNLFFNSLIIISLNFLLIFSLFYFSKNFILTEFFKNKISFSYISKSIIISYLNVIIILYLSLLRALEKPFLYISIGLIKLISIGILNIFFLILLKQHLKGFINSYYYSLIIITIIILIFHFLKHHDFNINFNIIKKLVIFAMPIGFINLLNWSIKLSNRLFLNQYFDEKLSGLFGIGSNIGTIIFIAFIAPFAIAWGPYSYKMDKEKKAIYAFPKIFIYVSIILSILSVGLSIFSKEIIKFIIKDNYYLSSYKIVPFITIGYFFLGINYIVSVGINITKKTYLHLPVVITATIINIAGNIILIPKYKIFGAAISFLISYMSFPFVSNFFSQKYYKINYNWSILFKILVITICTILLSLIINIKNLLLLLIIKMIIIIFFCIILYHLFLNAEERTKITTYYEKIISKIHL